MTSTTQAPETPPLAAETLHLSHFAQRHFDVLSLHEHTESEDETVGIAAVGTDSGNDLTEFTCFLRLPQELQDHIFKMYIRSNPQIFYVGSRRDLKHNIHTPSAILNINRKIREHAINEYGYIQQIIPCSDNSSKFHLYTFHPDVDMLFLDQPLHHQPRLDIFLESGIQFTRLRSLALRSHSFCPGGKDVWKFLSKLGKLELLFVVKPTPVKIPADSNFGRSLHVKGWKRGFQRLPKGPLNSELSWWPGFTDFVFKSISDRMEKEWSKSHGEEQNIPEIVGVVEFVRER